MEDQEQDQEQDQEPDKNQINPIVERDDLIKKLSMRKGRRRRRRRR
jgi:hypothetical protein